jgi:PHD/YefM family antitoxin component YafN of YafNO toxin-antitoxin module
MERVMTAARMNVKRVTVTAFRDRLRHYLEAAKANRLVLVENRRQPSKYLVDKEFLDSLVEERESVMATLEILADRELTDRLLNLAKTLDDDVAAGRLLTTADVFGK